MLQSIGDAAVLEQRLRHEFDKVWVTRLAELRARLDDVGIDTVVGCFNVKAVLPAAMAGAAGAMALPLNPIAAGAAGLALGVIPALRDRRKAANDALRASPVSYLYRLERDPAPKDMWGWVRQRARVRDRRLIAAGSVALSSPAPAAAERRGSTSRLLPRAGTGCAGATRPRRA